MAVGQKRRNSEKRKEKSRDAARNRRGKESEIFSDLASQLPMSSAMIEQLDKASVMRLLLSNVKIQTLLQRRPKLELPEDELEAKIDTYYPKALEGFLILLSKEGDVIYVSDTVAKYLGIQQIDLLGQSIFEYAHPCDHEEIQELLSPHHHGNQDVTQSHTIFVRLKCTLTSKGRNVNLKSASYKVIRLTGKFVKDEITEESMEEDVDHETERIDDDLTEDEDNDRAHTQHKRKRMPYLIAMGETIPHPSNIEVPLDRHTFTSRHSMNMKFTDCDDRIKRLIGYSQEEVIGQSFFGFHHALDSKMMEKAFKDLFSKGQTTTGQYRFLAKSGGYVWVVTQATVIYNNRTQKPQCVVCVHYLLSHVEQHGRILAQVQVPSFTVKKEEPLQRIQCQMPTIPKLPQKREHRGVTDLFHVPTFSTEDVFRDKTQDMEQEFYFPPGVKKTVDKTTKLLDLWHLAPQDGEIDIPLSTPTKLRRESKSDECFDTGVNLYDDFAKIDDSDFKSNLPILLPPADDSPSRRQLEDVNYSSSASSSPRMDMGEMSMTSPSKYLTTINQSDIRNVESMFETYDSTDALELDFTTRAPFIPMCSDQSLVEPTAEVLLDTGEDLNPRIFGSTESVFNLKEEMYDGPPPEKKSKSVYEMIDTSNVTALISQPQDNRIMKMKRTLDRSCLETGPPVKMAKYSAKVLLDTIVQDTDQQKANSVLKNLLLNGEDTDFGYKVANNMYKKRAMSSSVNSQPEFLRHLLCSVTQHDMEVNAPTHSGHLLQGQDIRLALNMGQK